MNLIPKSGKTILRGEENKKMNCLICKSGAMKNGTTILPIERGNAILIVTDIPARICDNCGEAYIDEETARDVQEIAAESLSGIKPFQKRQGQRTLLQTAFSEHPHTVKRA